MFLIEIEWSVTVLRMSLICSGRCFCEAQTHRFGFWRTGHRCRGVPQRRSSSASQQHVQTICEGRQESHQGLLVLRLPFRYHGLLLLPIVGGQ